MIRSAEPKDIGAMLDIYDDYILDTCFTFEYEVPSLEDFAGRVAKTQQQYPWLVAEIDGKVIGYAYAGAPFARAAYQWNVELSIYLDGKYHHKGVGTALYSCLAELLDAQGYHNLFAVITSENEKSLALTKTLGFVQEGSYKDVGFKLGRWLDVIWLSKRIKTAGSMPIMPIPFTQLDKNFVLLVFTKYAKLAI